ncbi:MAG: hypothetical protein AAGB02_03160 [Pseudomonadota bacterium]
MPARLVNAASIFDWCDDQRGLESVGLTSVALAPIDEMRVRSRATAMGYRGVDLLKLLRQVDYFEIVSVQLERERLQREARR